VSGAETDLGEGHSLQFMAWSPDRELNPQYAHLPDVEKFGAIVGHRLRDGDANAACVQRGRCWAAITFSGPVQQEIEHGRAVWDVASWDPLTITPSLLCHCGDHGFITGGRWVVA
jgi:hypothetical protein